MRLVQKCHKGYTPRHVTGQKSLIMHANICVNLCACLIMHTNGYKTTNGYLRRSSKGETGWLRDRKLITDEHRCKIFNKILANRIQQHIKKNHTP